MAKAVEARPLGQLSLLALAVNGIVGVGIFFAPSDVAALAPGNAGTVVFAATALVLVPVALTFATLGRAFDRDGALALFARHAFGDRTSFVVGWLAYVSAVFSAAAILSGLARATASGVGASSPFAVRLLSIALLVVLAAMCATGLKPSARAWTTLTVLKLAPLALLVGVAAFAQAPARAPVPASLTVEALLRAALTATFTYQGFEIVPLVAGQARDSRRTIPRAVILGLAITAVLYVSLHAACVHALPDLARSATPLADAASVFGGERLAAIMRAGTSVSALGIAFGMVAMTPRYLSAIEPLPLHLGVVDARGVPLRSLVATVVFVSLLLALGERAELFALSSVAVVVQYGLAAAALATLALRRRNGLAPVDAWPAAPTIAVSAALLIGAHAREWAVAATTVALGVVLQRLGRRPA